MNTVMSHQRRASRVVTVALATAVGVAGLLLVSNAQASHPYTCYFRASDCSFGSLSPNEVRFQAALPNQVGLFIHNESTARPKDMWASQSGTLTARSGTYFYTSTERIFTRHYFNLILGGGFQAVCRNRDIYNTSNNCAWLYT